MDARRHAENGTIMRQISPPKPRGTASKSGSVLLALVALLLAGGFTGFQGTVYQRAPDNAIGPTVADVALKFIKEDGSVIETVTSDPAGHYRIELEAGRYRVTASHVSYEDYSSAPGFFVVTGNDGYQTGNFFLREPRVTTVLLVRHADRDGANDALLVPQGTDRAEKLAEVAAKAGVSAIYSTSTKRTRATAQPLAMALDLDITPYVTSQEVARLIDNDHAGDVVLVVGHSNTTTPTVEAVLGQDFYPNDPHINDFDNLFILGKPVGGGLGSALNFQYGADTGPDTPNLSRIRVTTILLLRHAETAGTVLSAAGQARSQELVHVAVKAGVSALYAPQSAAAQATVQPLATTLGLGVLPYDAADLPGLVTEVFQNHSGEAVLVAADNASLKDLVRDFGARPMPPIFTNEYDHLMVLFAPGAGGNARLISLQFGDASP